MDIYFLRHGESMADLENKIESRYDAELTEKGMKQANEAAAYFKNNGIAFDDILSSPLKRAKGTAEMIATHQDQSITIEEDLAEVDRGVLCGLIRDAAAVEYPRKPYRTHYDLYPQDSGESSFAVRARCNKMLQKITERQNRQLLVVSHGSFLNALLGTLFMMPDQFNEATGTVFSFKDCEYIHIRKIEGQDRYIVLEKRIASCIHAS